MTGWKPILRLFGQTLIPKRGGISAKLKSCQHRRRTVWLTLEKPGRYPRVEDIIPNADSAKTRLSLSQGDRAFLLDVVPRLPSVTDQEDRVTLNLNGSVALLAQGDPPSPVTQVVLRNSHRIGDEVQLNTDRRFLVHAAQLGFHELEIHGPGSPLVCRDEHRVYLWAPLPEMPLLIAGPDSVQIESPLTTTLHRPTRHLPPPRRPRTATERTRSTMPQNRIAATLTVAEASQMIDELNATNTATAGGRR